jgi:hypothetical protein
MRHSGLAQPCASVGEHVRAAALPRPRRGHPDHLQPQRHADERQFADRRLDLGARHRPLRQGGAPAPCRRGHLRRGVAAALNSQPPPAAILANRLRKSPVVARRHQMDRRAQQRPLDRRAPLQGAVELVALEPRDPRPQADVNRRRVLGLQAGHPLERPRYRHLSALEQHLARQQGPVERPRAEDSAPGHLPIVPADQAAPRASR